MFKVNYKDVRTPLVSFWCFYCYRRRSGVFIINFEHISHLALMFLLLNLNMRLPTGMVCYNPWQNIWDKTEESSETVQDKKVLISTFSCFLTAIAKV